jgi:hypothetical protein
LFCSVGIRVVQGAPCCARRLEVSRRSEPQADHGPAGDRRGGGTDYLAGLNESDAREPDEAPNATAPVLEALKTRRAELDRMAAALEAEGRKTLVEGEADACPMGYGKGEKPPSYNVQTAVDADTGLIVHHAVTNEANDTRQLHPMASRPRKPLASSA